MDWRQHLDSFERSGKILDSLYDDVDDTMARWKPSPEKWSMLEILVHLWDEEREDFRVRLKSTLEDPARAWTPIDPEGWVGARRYHERDLAEVREGFARERSASLDWLRSLRDPDWERTHQHPKLGAIRAGDLFAAWRVHDWLHVRQVANLRVEYAARTATPFSTRYAMP